MAAFFSLQEWRREYTESVKEDLQTTRDYHSPIREDIMQQERHLLLLMIRELEEQVQEIQYLGGTHDEYRPITVHALFDSDEDKTVPQIVVLLGPAGIGKTTISRKMVLDWASGHLYQDKFDFVFYLSCGEFSSISTELNLLDLLSRTCKLQGSWDFLESILKDCERHRRLLFIVDGFDDLRWTLEEESDVCPDDPFQKTHKEVLLQRLLRKQLLKQSSLLVTCRPKSVRKLNTFISDSRYVEVLGLTKEEMEGYARKVFSNEDDAAKALRIIREHETLCAVPVVCWIVCTALRPQITDLDAPDYKTITSIYLLYLKELMKCHGRKQSARSCLKKLCALANEGILKLQTLFEEEDLERHGLSLCEVESMFAIRNIFYRDGQTGHSFLHPSVQAFLAALHYVLRDSAGDEEWTSGLRGDTPLPEICKGDSLSTLCKEHPRLTLSVKFLFGLLNKKRVEAFRQSTGCWMSLRVRTVLEEWLTGGGPRLYSTDAILCLYETQDNDFIRRTMAHFSCLKLDAVWTDQLSSFRRYVTPLCYCLAICEPLQSVTFFLFRMNPEDMDRLSPLLHQCQQLRFKHCRFPQRSCSDRITREGCLAKEQVTRFTDQEDSGREGESFAVLEGEDMGPADLSWLKNPQSKIQELSFCRCDVTSSSCEDLRSALITNPSLTKLHLTLNSPEDSGINLLCRGLRDPGRGLRELSLHGCDLTPVCCDELRSVLITSRSLLRLDLSLNSLEESGVKALCEGLRHPGCILQELSLYSCDLPPSCCEDFRSVLIVNRSLTILDFSYNNLKDSGLTLLCDALQEPGCTLKELRVRGCGLSPLCCDDLCSVLSTNRSLILLDLTLNALEDSGITRLCEALRDPACTLQTLRLNDCAATLLCCDAVCSVIATNQTLTEVEASFDVNMKMSDSEVDRWCEAFGHLCCSVGRTITHIHIKYRPGS